MKKKLTPVELMFALRLQILIENGSDISSCTKLGFLTNYTSVGAKKLCEKLHAKGVINYKTRMGKGGYIEIELLTDPKIYI